MTSVYSSLPTLRLAHTRLAFVSHRLDLRNHWRVIFCALVPSAVVLAPSVEKASLGCAHGFDPCVAVQRQPCFVRLDAVKEGISDVLEDGNRVRLSARQ